MVQLQYSLTKQDYVAYFVFVFWEAESRKKARFKNMLKQVGLSALFYGVIVYTGGFGKFSIPILTLLFLISFLPFISGRGDLEKQAEDIANDPLNASIFLQNLLTATDACVHIKNEVLDAKYTWKAISSKTENNQYYFLFLNAFEAIIIPKTAFVNQDEQQLFEKLLTKNISLEAEINYN